MCASRSSVPMKVILDVMKFVGITTLMISRENDMGRTLTGIGGLCYPIACSPKRCRSLRSSSLALRSSSLLARCIQLDPKLVLFECLLGSNLSQNPLLVSLGCRHRLLESVDSFPKLLHGDVVTSFLSRWTLSRIPHIA